MTLLIEKGKVNQLVTTLSELANENLPNNWLFVFTRDQELSVQKIFLDDISTSPEEYNKFLFDEPNDLTFMTGDYGYKCYQMPDKNDEDETRGKLVEVGKVRVIKAKAVVKSHKLNKDIKVYEKQ
jgi:hypothetical protein